jgi:hypothetical protein
MEVGGFFQHSEGDWLLGSTNNIAHRRFSVGEFDAFIRAAIPRSADQFQAGGMVSVQLFIDLVSAEPQDIVGDAGEIRPVYFRLVDLNYSFGIHVPSGRALLLGKDFTKAQAVTRDWLVAVRFSISFSSQS